MAIKDLYSAVQPTLSLDFANVKALDPRITFARASTGTYYGTSTAKAEENLLLRSQEFDNGAWSKNNVTVTANVTTAPDGTNTAESLVETTANGIHSVNNASPYVVTASPYTYSVFVKANGRSIAAINFFDGTNSTTWFDLSTGTVGTNASGSTATITASVNGWYRISVSRILSATSACYINTYASTTNGLLSYTGDGASGVFLWGAQLEQRSAVTAYTPTTDQPITNYIPVLETASANVARFDHDPVTGESLGLLVEEQRTNLLLRSEEFGTTWVNDGTSATIASNVGIAPNGLLTADQLVEDTGSGAKAVAQSVTCTGSTAYTFSVFIKAAGRTTGRIRLGGAGFIVAAIFDLAAGTATISGTGSVGIQNRGNGWYRVHCTGTTASGDTSLKGTIYVQNPSGTELYTGNGYSGLFLFGAQLEAGAFPTSYIKTEASQVTRSADSASITGSNFSSWYRQNEGTVYVEYINQNTEDVGDGNAPLVLFGWPGAGGIGVRIGYAAFRRLRSYVQIPSGSFEYVIDYPTVAPVNGQAVFSWSPLNSSAATQNGGAVSQDLTGSIGSLNVVYLLIGSAGFSTRTNGHIRKISYYPKRLSNTQLQALTS